MTDAAKHELLQAASLKILAGFAADPTTANGEEHTVKSIVEASIVWAKEWIEQMEKLETEQPVAIPRDYMREAVARDREEEMRDTFEAMFGKSGIGKESK